MNPRVEYLLDDDVDDALDQELRGLLSTCFTKPQDVVFRDQRYFLEPYRHRWIIRNEMGAMVAHVGVHEKRVESGDRAFPIGGIAEVCVHPDCRGRGYVRMMLRCIHAWLVDHGFTFAVLFGRVPVYRSSGYEQIDNLSYGSADDGWKPVGAMVHALSDTPWPGGDVHLPGPTF